MPQPSATFSTFVIEQLAGGFTAIGINVPDHTQNIMNRLFIDELSQMFLLLRQNPPRGLLVESRREDSFLAGADIDRIDAMWTQSPAQIMELCDKGRTLLKLFSSSSWPSVAIIDGVCLGGGLELALACDFRIATENQKAVLGMPEVKLGLMPGWGGTVRLPRLIGPGPAIELIASGESVTGDQAQAIGLVDACVSSSSARASALQLLEQSISTESFRKRRHEQQQPRILEKPEHDFLLATMGAVITGRTKGNYPAPVAVLETIVQGSAQSVHEAAAIESKAFSELARTSVAKQLVRVYRLSERNRKDGGLDDSIKKSPEEFVAVQRFNKPSVVGAGIMGAGITSRHLRSGFITNLVDINAEVLQKNIPSILEEAAWDRYYQKTNYKKVSDLTGLLMSSTQLSAISASDIVVESVTERTDFKQKVLAEIEAVVSASTVICTNTSTNPIATLATALSDPARFCGMHFFNPVRRMSLVEVIRGPDTSDSTVAAVVLHAKRLKKVPVVVRDSPGFLVNRVLTPYLHESVELLREGVDLARIDKVSRRFGMPLGPFELYDMVGLDTAFYAGLVMANAIGDRIDASPVIPALVKAGWLGRKTGCGFYKYNSTGHDAKIDTVNEKLNTVIEPYRLPERQITDEKICDRLFIPMLVESLLVLDEGIVRDGCDIDLAVIHALGFPAFRGGVLAWGDSLGATEVVRRLDQFEYLGPRMMAPARLLAHADSGLPFAAVGERVPVPQKHVPVPQKHV
ncbi:3-hydroxyacyl-CoA dehydrogenase NAD-binding domain-containing protein [Pirellulales bacterium]|nr:3-hydroxyacyl-CoA dehydrogenase NAD-binding domain-containing protein [Pirellulales bacterium]